MNELIKYGNSEFQRIGNLNKERIDSETKSIVPIEKELLSSKYSNGNLKIFKQKNTLKKLIKTYSQNDTTFTESYYFSGIWPSYVEIKNSTQKNSNKFYFDKTNLMLWIDNNHNQLNFDSEKFLQWWLLIGENIDKLSIASKTNKKIVNEDEIKLPEPPPMTKADSLEIEKFKIDLWNPIPDSLKK